jgi:hypothetical protein
MPETEKAQRSQTRLIRAIAREIAYEVIDEHLEDYEHTPKTPHPAELEA